MSRKFALTLAAFAILVIAGILLLSPGTPQRSAAIDLGPVLPKLGANMNAVDTITLSDVEGSVELVRAGGPWQFKDLPGIPVSQGKVREFLLDLAQGQLVEAKTDNPAFHSAVGLGAAGTLIDFGEVGALILGKEGAAGGRFVRRGGEDQTYLAKGVDVPDVALKSWASITLPVAEKELVTRVRVDDGVQPYTVSVSGDEQTLEGLSEDEALAYDGVLDTVVAGAVYLDYDSVRLASEISWEGAGKTVFFGPGESDTLIYEIADVDDQLWLRAIPTGVFKPESDIDWGQWAFEISDYRKQTLLKPRSELLLSEDAP